MTSLVPYLFLLIGIIVGVGISEVWHRRPHKVPVPQTRVRALPAPNWVGTAISTLDDSFLGVETSTTVAGLKPNQGNFLERLEYKVVRGQECVAIPVDALLTDVHGSVFVFRDNTGQYHMFTRGAMTPHHELNPSADCVRAILTVTRWTPE